MPALRERNLVKLRERLTQSAERYCHALFTLGRNLSNARNEILRADHLCGRPRRSNRQFADGIGCCDGHRATLVRNHASVISPSETLMAKLTTSPHVTLPSAPNPSGASMSPAYWGSWNLWRRLSACTSPLYIDVRRCSERDPVVETLFAGLGSRLPASAQGSF